MIFISDSNFSFKLCGQPLSIKRLFFNLNDTALNVTLKEFVRWIL